MTEIALKNRRPNKEKLLAFGFKAEGEELTYAIDIVDGQMNLSVFVQMDGKIFVEITDSVSGEEYTLYRVPDAAGAFVGRVRAEYGEVLEEISQKCCDTEVFKSEQAKEVIAFVRDTYGDELEFLWEKFPDNAVWRRRDSRKWYAALLTVSRRRIGLNSDERVEILDLRISPEKMTETVDGVKYFPGYHMNKNHWITVCLDGTVETYEICERLKESYRLAK